MLLQASLAGNCVCEVLPRLRSPVLARLTSRPPQPTSRWLQYSGWPVWPQVRAAIDRVRAERPRIGSAPLFPSPADPMVPISRQLARSWLLQAEELAKLEPQKGSLWRAYRRQWAREREHLPDADVAAAGGWKETSSLKRAYQQADQATMLRVVVEAGEQREVR